MSITQLLKNIISTLTTIIELVLVGRFILKLIGANPVSEFTQFVYGLTDPLMQPFLGITPTANIDGAVFDFSIIIAMAVYVIVGTILLWAITLIDQAGQVDTMTDKRSHDDTPQL